MCCGSSRAQYRGTSVSLPPPRLAPKVAASNSSAGRSPGPTFEYIGRTGLTVTGAVTGRVYRFERAGSRVGVDPRDRPSMGAIPVLRQV